MATILKTNPHQRRPLWMLGVAILILLVAIGSRYLLDQTRSITRNPAPAPIERSSTDAIERLQQQVRANPENSNAYAELGLGLLQQVRLTGDMSLYGAAGEAFDAALQRDPLQVDALMGQGVLALALHDFQGAITWAEKARARNPFRAGILGILVDAHVELGQYDKAVALLQQMVDLRPDLQSYSRVSYLRELYGDVDGAVEAMQTAVTSAAPGTEDWRWTLTHLGNLHFNRGDLDGAEHIYAEVLAQQPDYPYAQAGVAKVAVARGEVDAAIDQYTALTKRLPLPEFVIALGELYEANGNQSAAAEQYGLVGVMQQLNMSTGMNVDLEMASFTAKHGVDARQAIADARLAYADRPTIYAADALSWALYRNGDYEEAWRYSEEARRLNTQDALLYYHAGMIAEMRGKSTNAEKLLTQALAINPYFSPLDVPMAEGVLAGLQGE